MTAVLEMVAQLKRASQGHMRKTYMRRACEMSCEAHAQHVLLKLPTQQLVTCGMGTNMLVASVLFPLQNTFSAKLMPNTTQHNTAVTATATITPGVVAKLVDFGLHKVIDDRIKKVVKRVISEANLGGRLGLGRPRMGVSGPRCL